MLGLNVLMLCAVVACAVLFSRARLGRVAGTAMGLVFVGASVVPLYGAWLTPEMFNLTLVFVAYFLWLYKEVAPPTASAFWRRPWLEWAAAFLLGVATFSKPSQAPLIGPIALTLVWRRQWKQMALVSAVSCSAVRDCLG
jgi:4-amino-4-deoxy-L-arabinose transferase-like glycosyltransferase